MRRGAYMELRPLPVGIDDFSKIIEGNYCYVDKTWMIKELLDKKSEVNLFTRPRRFGKTLNMNMLQCFFEDTGSEEKNIKNQRLFSGLRITEAGDSYTKEMSKYPVIYLSLKSAKQSDFQTAYYCLKEEIAREYKRHRHILDLLELEEDKKRFQNIMSQSGDDVIFSTSLRFLCDCLEQTCGQKVIILIDEYDVPLENAYFGGFYDKMVNFIRSLFESALKSNPQLAFSVITGCLRISRESIFTGLNNLNVISILSNQYDEYFGFNQAEVDVLLRSYGLEDKRDVVKKWYDGYLFGQAQVYNPWSVINYVLEASSGGQGFPRPYWSNTSSNSIIQDLVKRADVSVKLELENIMAGGTIEKSVHEDITYDTVYNSSDNLWNFLLFTGYLKQTSQRMAGRDLIITMAIPNEEVAYIYDNTVKSWFQDEVAAQDLSDMYQAMLTGNAEKFQKDLSTLLQKSISYMDSREAFYHGFVLGVLGNMRDYLIQSNRESGDGRPDIIIRHLDVNITPVILELKVSDTFKEMDSICDIALGQIEDKRYTNGLSEDGYSSVWCYGISFFRKQCRIKAKYKDLKV